MITRASLRFLSRLACLVVVATCVPRTASTQTLDDVLSFLLTNRSIATDDFVRDEAAAAATRDSISRFLLIELGTLPVSSSSGGFTYRLEPTLGATLRSSDSFGPFLTERSLTSGARQISVGISYQQARYQDIDGRSLTNGTLVSTASKLQNESTPFDVETVSLHLKTDTMTIQTNVGVTDRLDVGAVLPVVRLTLSGQRLDTYRGRQSVQAIASGTSSGPGDLLLRTKLNVFRRGASGVSIGADGRLPTGNEQNLLGSGKRTITPRAMVSFERSRVGVHATGGYTFGGFSPETDLSLAGTVVATPRLTLVGEVAGRRLASAGHLVDVTAPHPTLANVQTIRLTTTDEQTTRALILAGVKWNVLSTWLLSASVLRPLTDSGLNSGWIPTITFDRSFGR